SVTTGRKAAARIYETRAWCTAICHSRTPHRSAASPHCVLRSRITRTSTSQHCRCRAQGARLGVATNNGQMDYAEPKNARRIVRGGGGGGGAARPPPPPPLFFF